MNEMEEKTTSKSFSGQQEENKFSLQPAIMNYANYHPTKTKKKQLSFGSFTIRPTSSSKTSWSSNDSNQQQQQQSRQQHHIKFGPRKLIQHYPYENVAHNNDNNSDQSGIRMMVPRLSLLGKPIYLSSHKCYYRNTPSMRWKMRLRSFLEQPQGFFPWLYHFSM